MSLLEGHADFVMDGVGPGGRPVGRRRSGRSSSAAARSAARVEQVVRRLLGHRRQAAAVPRRRAVRARRRRAGRHGRLQPGLGPAREPARPRTRSPTRPPGSPGSSRPSSSPPDESRRVGGTGAGGRRRTAGRARASWPTWPPATSCSSPAAAAPTRSRSPRRWRSRRRGPACAPARSPSTTACRPAPASGPSKVAADLAALGLDPVEVAARSRSAAAAAPRPPPGRPATRPWTTRPTGSVPRPCCSATPATTRPRPCCSAWPAGPGPARSPGWPPVRGRYRRPLLDLPGRDRPGSRRRASPPGTTRTTPTPPSPASRVRRDVAARAGARPRPRRRRRAGPHRGAAARRRRRPRRLGRDGPAPRRPGRRRRSTSASWPPCRPRSGPGCCGGPPSPPAAPATDLDAGHVADAGPAGDRLARAGPAHLPGGVAAAAGVWQAGALPASRAAVDLREHPPRGREGPGRRPREGARHRGADPHPARRAGRRDRRATTRARTCCSSACSRAPSW